jgi:hypothetical protein
MTSGLDASIRWVVAVVGVAIVWLAFFKLNGWLFSQFEYTERAHWIFLPAALRVIAILSLGSKGALGLMVGAYFTLPHEDPNDLTYEIALSVSSGLAPLAAVAICERFFKINSDLGGLRGSHIVALSVVSALANSVLLNILMAATGRHHGDGMLAATIFIGDMLGTVLLLFTIAVGISVYARSRGIRG